jgi:hypothetical protein
MPAPARRPASPGTGKYDRTDKLKIYAREKVPWVWLVDPRSGRWNRCASTKPDGLCAVPGATMLAFGPNRSRCLSSDLSALWADVVVPG